MINNMKTVTLQGEFQKFQNLNQATRKFDADRLPYEVEIRVYVVDKYIGSEEPVDTSNWSDEEFISESEKQGSVYTLKGFEVAYSREDINAGNDAIRFITVPLF